MGGTALAGTWTRRHIAHADIMIPHEAHVTSSSKLKKRILLGVD